MPQPRRWRSSGLGSNKTYGFPETVGTINLDIVDSERMQLIWEVAIARFNIMMQ